MTTATTTEKREQNENKKLWQDIRPFIQVHLSLNIVHLLRSTYAVDVHLLRVLYRCCVWIRRATHWNWLIVLEIFNSRYVIKFIIDFMSAIRVRKHLRSASKWHWAPRCDGDVMTSGIHISFQHSFSVGHRTNAKSERILSHSHCVVDSQCETAHPTGGDGDGCNH